MNVLSFILAGLLVVSLTLFARLHSRYIRLKRQRSREVRVATRPMKRQIERLEADGYLLEAAELMGAAIEAQDFGELRLVLQEKLPRFDLPEIWKIDVSDQDSPYFSVMSRGLEDLELRTDVDFLQQHVVELQDQTIRFYLPEIPDDENFYLELIGGEIFRAVSQIRNNFTDSMTGVWSRQYLLMRLSEELERAHRHRHWVSLLMLDGDKFKHINDTYGHLVGDEVIRELSKILRRIHHRSSDIVSRYGGDEFLVMLPETRPQQAREDAERTRSAIADSAIRTSKGDLSFSCSVGTYSVLPNNVPTSVEKMLKRTDEALYAAKARGGNCVVTYKNGSSKGE